LGASEDNGGGVAVEEERPLGAVVEQQLLRGEVGEDARRVEVEDVGGGGGWGARHCCRLIDKGQRVTNTVRGWRDRGGVQQWGSWSNGGG